MKAWLAQLDANLTALEKANRLRLLRPTDAQTSSGPMVRRGGRLLLNLAGNDYLALAGHPHLRAAAIAAIEQYGVGSGASRLVSGHLPLHAEVEARFAAFKHAEAALLFPTGFMANFAVLTTLAGPGDLLLCDKLNHASLIDAARASGATLRVFPHLNYDKLQRLLEKSPATSQRGLDSSSPAQSASRPPRTFIVTDSIFSMDGDVADLPRICDLAERHEAIVIVDEAHATGVLGEDGSGLCKLQGVADRVDVVVSTASKALGGLGGIVTGPRLVIETLVNHARAFIYTTAVPPAQAATLHAALDIVRDEPQRRGRLAEITTQVHHHLKEINMPPKPSRSRGWESPQQSRVIPTPILPLIVGDDTAALALSAHLETAGILAPAIRPPTVAPGSARVRLTLRADLQPAHLDQLFTALKSWDKHHGP